MSRFEVTLILFLDLETAYLTLFLFFELVALVLRWYFLLCYHMNFLGFKGTCSIQQSSTSKGCVACFSVCLYSMPVCIEILSGITLPNQLSRYITFFRGSFWPDAQESAHSGSACLVVYWLGSAIPLEPPLSVRFLHHLLSNDPLASCLSTSMIRRFMYGWRCNIWGTRAVEMATILDSVSRPDRRCSCLTALDNIYV